MAETPVATAIPDVDIEEDIQNRFKFYKPLFHDRHHFQISVSEGEAMVEGYVKGRITQRYLLDNLPLVEGVKSVNAKKFYNDEAIRLAAGAVVPVGIFVRVEYGLVVLSGRLPEGTDASKLVKQVGEIPGVYKVVTDFAD